MDSRLRFTTAFEEDVHNALLYIETVLASPQAAQKLMKAIDKEILRIATQPFICAISAKPYLKEHEYRECFVNHYVIIYRLHGEEIVFLRLFHQSQHYERFVMSWSSED